MTKFIKDRYLRDNSKKGRIKAGAAISGLGILLNLILFCLKLTAGILSGSVAITADGFNNLADSGSCVLALLGLKLGCKPPDKKYPLGYGRLEYLSGMLISAAILFIGGRMMISSVSKIISPEPVDGCGLVIVILLLSVAIKGCMYRCYSTIGRMIHSSGMRAAAMDSLSDCIATMAILAAVTIERLTGFNADGYTGVLVAVCILYAGMTSVRESVGPLLGKAPDKEFTDKLKEISAEFKEIKAIDDIAVHDYGPHKKIITFFLKADDAQAVIPKLRKRIKEKLGYEAVICPEYENDNTENKITLKDQQ